MASWQLPAPRFNPRITPRVHLVGAAMALLAAYVAGRSVMVQTVDAPRLQRLAAAQQVGRIPIPGLRGSILDREGRVLAASVGLLSVAANPREISNRESAALILGRALEVPERRIRALLASPGTFVWLARKVPYRLSQRVERLNVSGVFSVREESGRRFHPKGLLARNVLGDTGIDDNGQDGIEGAFDAALRGRFGHLDAVMDPSGAVLARGITSRVPARQGHDVYLTIDERVQSMVERRLEHAVKRHRARGAVCVVLDARSGDILAMACKPDAPGNRAVTDPYEPGSTFKVFLAAAALDSGRVTMDDRFFSGSSIQVGGWSIHNANDGLGSDSGTETLQAIITYSFNVGTTAVALRLGRKPWHSYMNRFGFGQMTGLPLPGESAGILPHLANWQDITLATTSFGQGVAVTPLQLASGMQALANDGLLMRPRLVRKIVSAEGEIVRTYPQLALRRVVSSETASHMRAIMRNVVTNGTGKLAEVPGHGAVGKTGTAQVAEGGAYRDGRYVASFLGYAPVHAPRVVVLVKVEEPSGVYWGGTVAAPIFREIAGEALWLLGVLAPQLDAEHSSDQSLAPDQTLRRRPIDKPR